MEVPDKQVVSVSDRCDSDLTPLPGANKSKHRPKLEYLARLSERLLAPTVIAPAALAGDTLQAS